MSRLLDQVHAIEHAMDLFNRKGDRGDLERAAGNFNDMLGHVDRLGEIIAEARSKQRAVVECAAEPIP